MTDPKRPKRLPTNSGRAYDAGFKSGHKAGYEACRVDILSYMEEKYMGEGRPDRDSPEARAILVLAGDLADHMQRNMVAETLKI